MTGALLALGAASGGGAGCSGSKGQLMFAFQTDMSLPKDIDAIRVLVTLEGTVIFDQTYRSLGSEEGIKLPATLGFLTPDDPSQALRLRVIATQGGDDQIRVLREVVTTVPEDRTALLAVPLHFLCYGSGEAERNPDGTVKRDGTNAVVARNSLCDEGQTCEAGACVKAVKPSEELIEYEPTLVFGGGDGDGSGLCFDTVGCFEQGVASAELSDATAGECRARLPHRGTEINVALLTRGGGICGDRACYVPMDAQSTTGWRAADDGWITLPEAVCTKAKEGKLVGLAVADASETCPMKDAKVPTCGPWSSSGRGLYTAPDQAQPLPLALWLLRPIALAATQDTEARKGRIYWVEGGTFDDSTPNPDGAVRWIPRDGGDPLSIAEELRAPSDLVIDQDTGVVFWTVTGMDTQDGEIRAWSPETEAALPVLTGRRRPLGIARYKGASTNAKSLVWTEQLGDQVFQATTAGAGPELIAQDDVSALTEGALLGASPYRVAAAADVVCWIYEGGQQREQRSPGAVACKRQGEPARIVAEQQGTPQAIALDVDAEGNAQAVYWADMEHGTISRINLGGSDLGAPEIFAEGQAAPRGIAIDREFVFWTNWQGGTVMYAPKAGGAPVELARGQDRPRAIVVDQEAVYWTNEGAVAPAMGGSDVPVGNGAVMRLLKEPAGL
ncbi:hypothetical protein [Sorangium sp. So ce1335]|uniref:hypothetical protein n=1 Tax=Sorangium sp. So ce1335 TaxID=3133335 RepID=UPI003F64289B